MARTMIPFVILVVTTFETSLRNRTTQCNLKHRCNYRLWRQEGKHTRNLKCYSRTWISWMLCMLEYTITIWYSIQVSLFQVNLLLSSSKKIKLWSTKLWWTQVSPCTVAKFWLTIQVKTSLLNRFEPIFRKWDQEGCCRDRSDWRKIIWRKWFTAEQNRSVLWSRGQDDRERWSNRWEWNGAQVELC